MDRIPLKGSRTGSHVTYRDEDGRLVVEWYDFGDDCPYESANLIIFDADAEAALRNLLKVPETSLLSMMESIVARFDTYWAVRAFAEAHAIKCAHVVDFQP
jgi:hypothetical protein